jgi:acyl-CoA reductase-like NAD-dependent aldehyde dehydrogenase
MLQVINPATGLALCELRTDSPEMVSDKYQQARLAQPAWAALKIQERCAFVRRFQQQLIERQEELAGLLTSETGKPLQQSLNELKGVQGRIEFFLKNTEDTIQALDMLPPGHNPAERLTFEPLGVIANISAWNYPYLVGANVFIPALLTGNTVLYKPSEFASLTGQAIFDMFTSSGLPEGVLSVIIGKGEVGAHLLQQPIDGVYFTGSHATGVKIAAGAAPNLMRVQLELGGKDPVYVMEDAPVAAAATALADGAFYNAGQSCCAVERIYVRNEIMDEFVKHFVVAAQKLVVGSPTDSTTTLGPLTRPAQLDVLDAQVQDALQKGAQLKIGGQRVPGPGSFYQPTVMTQVNHTMDLMTQESFGPIIGIQGVSSDSEALELMNDSPYGLTAAVYSPDQQRAQGILARVNSGTVYWNCCDRVSPHLPWTGRGNSGIGSTLSTLGIQAFVQPKSWHMNGDR